MTLPKLPSARTAYFKAYRAANKEKILETARARYAANPEKVRVRSAARYKADPAKKAAANERWRLANLERSKATKAAWNKANPKKMAAASATWQKANPAKCNAATANRRAAKLQATPAWANLDDIRDVYIEAAALGLEVDHIFPIRGRSVSGLHVWENLQLLTKSENARKGNRMPQPPPT